MTPQRAPVRPRVLGQIGEAILLEEEILSLVGTGARGLVQLVGPTGSGKTVALQHLAAVLPAEAGVRLVDDLLVAIANAPRSRLGVYATALEVKRRCVAVYRLAPWGADEWIEYLLAVHRPACASVMGRLRAAPDRGVLPPLPELWRIVLDEMAGDETVAGPRQALHRFLARQVNDVVRQQLVQSLCLTYLLNMGNAQTAVEEKLQRECYPASVVRAIRHPEVQQVLAAEYLLSDLRAGAPCEYLEHRLPRALVREVAARVARNENALDHLRKLVSEGRPQFRPMAASILHATDTGWMPDGEGKLNLAGAYLDHAAWPYLRMAGANLREADLSHAYLREAVLDGAIVGKAKLDHANLQGASLVGLAASQADLSYADLSLAKAERVRLDGARLKGTNLEGAGLRRALLLWADLSGACLAGADLSEASLRGASITGADFSGALLAGAQLPGLCLREAAFAGALFAGADLTRCDLEYVQLPAADFRGAALVGAYLTGSWMPETNFEGAILKNAGLADINWEGASLRGADLRGASFHAGSSRNGLVGSPIACEGSRTG
ncbi:MAG TPA: pentapeptide repeat-containing protein, partial [Gemmataceae bacterium]|nr:pentapeptide repeat-containing protein [Gemmataceae bacterium]